MTIPLQVAFEGGLEASDALNALIAHEAAKLERFHDRITSCRVAVIGRSHRHRQGGLYAVRLQITGPGDADVVIDRNPPLDHAHEDVTVAIRDAFNAARRRLQDRHRRLEGQTKIHEAQPRGRVVELLQDQDSGRLETEDGRELYFHRNSVLGGGFDKLRVGEVVRYAEEQGDKGPQASTVHPSGRVQP